MAIAARVRRTRRGANFRARHGMFLAAGLAFYFLVCLVPMLFLFVSVAGFS